MTSGVQDQAKSLSLRGRAARWGMSLVNPATLRTDVSRGSRAAIAFIGPVLLASLGKFPLEASFAALAAQNIAMVDVRGSYALRLGLLLAMGAVLTGSAGLGGLVAPSVAATIAGAALIALLAGVWRHLSSEYGMSLSISATLVFLLAESRWSAGVGPELHALSTLSGALWGVLIQVFLWPIRAEHPLRRLVSDSWTSAADLFEAMLRSSDPKTAGAASPEQVADREGLLRTTLDSAYAGLDSARKRPIVTRLRELNTCSANLALAVVSFTTLLEATGEDEGSDPLTEAFQPALRALTNFSRTVAIATVSQQPAHVATVEIRYKRLTALLKSLESRMTRTAATNPEQARLAEAGRLITEYLGRTVIALQSAVARSGERASFSLELFDMHTWTLRSLSMSLNFSSKVDPAIVRFSLRLAFMMMLGVLLQKEVPHVLPFALGHAYWLPFTIAVVMQPEYGATRARALQRTGGTLIGGLAAGVLLWLEAPQAVVILAIAVTSFVFGFLIRRNYGVAVVFVTLFVVLVTDVSGPAALRLAGERLFFTTSGGLLALGAAYIFWPVWEKRRYGTIIARALRSNAAYLELLADRMSANTRPSESLSKAKQAAESANTASFSSLRRMIADPKNQQEGVELAAALCNGNQRFTRILNLFTVHLRPEDRLIDPRFDAFCALALKALTRAADAFEDGSFDLGSLALLREELDGFRFPAASHPGTPAVAGSAHRAWVFAHLERAATELSALLMTAEQGAASTFRSRPEELSGWPLPAG